MITPSTFPLHQVRYFYAKMFVNIYSAFMRVLIGHTFVIKESDGEGCEAISPH